MNRKKTVAVAIVLALLLLIGGLLAYFTDTDSKTNKFTLGEQKVEISVVETQWDALEDTDEEGQPGYGIPDIAEDIIPGKTITKDPKIQNDSDTNSVCAFAEVVVPAVNATTPLFTYTVNGGWYEMGTGTYDDTAKTITHRYAYGTSEAMTELEAGQSTTNPVFSSVTFNTALDETLLTGVATAQQIDVNAYGIQYDNIGDDYTPATVWELFE